MEFAKWGGQVLLAILAAVLGAHYALAKAKRERLWVDRYEALRKVVVGFHTIQHHYEAAHMESMGVLILSGTEADLLRTAATNAMMELRNALASLVLLFAVDELSELFERHTALREAVTGLNHSDPHEFQDALANVAGEAERGAAAAAALARLSW